MAETMEVTEELVEGSGAVAVKPTAVTLPDVAAKKDSKGEEGSMESDPDAPTQEQSLVEQRAEWLKARPWSSKADEKKMDDRDMVDKPAAVETKKEGQVSVTSRKSWLATRPWSSKKRVMDESWSSLALDSSERSNSSRHLEELKDSQVSVASRKSWLESKVATYANSTTRISGGSLSRLDVSDSDLSEAKQGASQRRTWSLRTNFVVPAPTVTCRAPRSKSLWDINSLKGGSGVNIKSRVKWMEEIAQREKKAAAALKPLGLSCRKVDVLERQQRVVAALRELKEIEQKKEQKKKAREKKPVFKTPLQRKKRSRVRVQQPSPLVIISPIEGKTEEETAALLMEGLKTSVLKAAGSDGKEIPANSPRSPDKKDSSENRAVPAFSTLVAAAAGQATADEPMGIFDKDDNLLAVYTPNVTDMDDSSTTSSLLFEGEDAFDDEVDHLGNLADAVACSDRDAAASPTSEKDDEMLKEAYKLSLEAVEASEELVGSAVEEDSKNSTKAEVSEAVAAKMIFQQRRQSGGTGKSSGFFGAIRKWFVSATVILLIGLVAAAVVLVV